MSLPAFDSALDHRRYLDHLMPQQLSEVLVQGVVSDLWIAVAERAAPGHVHFRLIELGVCESVDPPAGE
jgi:hypothetical protein